MKKVSYFICVFCENSSSILLFLTQFAKYILCAVALGDNSIMLHTYLLLALCGEQN